MEDKRRGRYGNGGDLGANQEKGILNNVLGVG
jgi:hypothetical protein